jgi:uracil-DNA glycosylase
MTRKTKYDHFKPVHTIPLHICFHPSQQNTITGKLTEGMMEAVFARARALVER